VLVKLASSRRGSSISDQKITSAAAQTSCCRYRTSPFRPTADEGKHHRWQQAVCWHIPVPPSVCNGGGAPGDRPRSRRSSCARTARSCRGHDTSTVATDRHGAEGRCGELSTLFANGYEEFDRTLPKGPTRVRPRWPDRSCRGTRSWTCAENELPTGTRPSPERDARGSVVEQLAELRN